MWPTPYHRGGSEHDARDSVRTNRGARRDQVHAVLHSIVLETTAAHMGDIEMTLYTCRACKERIETKPVIRQGWAWHRECLEK